MSNPSDTKTQKQPNPPVPTPVQDESPKPVVTKKENGQVIINYVRRSP